MSAIVPVQLLLLFTWQEVVLQACGLRGVEFLKANTGRVAGARLSKYSSASHGSERARFTSYWIQYSTVYASFEPLHCTQALAVGARAMLELCLR